MSKARFSQKRGAATQRVAALRLQWLGFHMVVAISTPTALIKGKRIFCATAEGDLRAVGPNGISILAEAKWRPERLVFSDLEDHQVSALDRHLGFKGLSLVVWQARHGVYVLPWDTMRACGFKPSQGIGQAWAEKAQLQRDQLWYEGMPIHMDPQMERLT